MRPLIVSLSVVTAIALVLALSGVGSGGQAAAPAQETRLAAAIDVTPIQQELTAIRTELAALREAVTDAKGLRGDVAKAAEAIALMQTSLSDMAQSVKKLSDPSGPVLKAVRPDKWEYHVLRNHNEQSANHFGSLGWELAASCGDSLIFKRPLDDGKARPQE